MILIKNYTKVFGSMGVITSNHKNIFDVGLDALLKATCKMNCRVAFCTQTHQCMFANSQCWFFE